MYLHRTLEYICNGTLAMERNYIRYRFELRNSGYVLFTTLRRAKQRQHCFEVWCCLTNPSCLSGIFTEKVRSPHNDDIDNDYTIYFSSK